MDLRRKSVACNRSVALLPLTALDVHEEKTSSSSTLPDAISFSFDFHDGFSLLWRVFHRFLARSAYKHRLIRMKTMRNNSRHSGSTRIRALDLDSIGMMQPISKQQQK